MSHIAQALSKIDYDADSDTVSITSARVSVQALAADKVAIGGGTATAAAAAKVAVGDGTTTPTAADEPEAGGRALLQAGGLALEVFGATNLQGGTIFDSRATFKVRCGGRDGGPAGLGSSSARALSGARHAHMQPPRSPPNVRAGGSCLPGQRPLHL